MDLLLHLVKKQEVSIHDVSISQILSDFLSYLKALETLDLDNIGEFVVMASTLMEIKSGELLPRQELDLGEELDPRDELIRQILEYRRYRDLTRRLHRYGKLREQLLSRGSLGADPMAMKEVVDGEREREIEESLDLEDLDVWFLLKSYARLLEETDFGKTYTVETEQKPLGVYLDELLERLERSHREGSGELPFAEAFDPIEGKMAVICTFLAILELVKQGRLLARQDDAFGEIFLSLLLEDEELVSTV